MAGSLGVTPPVVGAATVEAAERQPASSADVISQRRRDAGAVEQAITMSREQLGAHTQASDASLAGRQQLIDQRLGEVQSGRAHRHRSSVAARAAAR